MRREGQIIQRGTKWLVRVYLGRENGKRTYANRTVKGTEKDAKTVLNALLSERDKGMAVAPAKATLNAYLDRWLADALKPRVRAFTFHNSEKLLERHVRKAIGAKKLAKVTPLDVQAVYTAMTSKGLSAKTVRYVH